MHTLYEKKVRIGFFAVLLTAALLMGIYACLPGRYSPQIPPTSPERMTITEWQMHLMLNGHPLPIHGADGRLGIETETAWNDYIEFERHEKP